MDKTTWKRLSQACVHPEFFSGDRGHWPWGYI